MKRGDAFQIMLIQVIEDNVPVKHELLGSASDINEAEA
jgi:hypothetical protein